MIKGVQMFTVRDHVGSKEEFKESLKKIKKIGYECLQMGVPAFMEPQEAKDLIDEIGLVSTTAYADFEKMLEDPTAIKAAVESARLFNNDLVGIGTLPEKQRDHKEGFEQFAKDMNKVAGELYKEGCKLVYHNHALEFYSLGGGKHGMDILLNETCPECVYFSLDTHWLASGGVNPAEWIYKVKGRMPLVHFKDYAIGPEAEIVEGVSKMFAEVGEGNLDWPGIVKACNDIGVKYVIVEQDECKGDPFDSLEISYKNMLKFNV